MKKIQSIKLLESEDAFINNYKFGYTQGELSEDFEDFDGAFNPHKHVYWTYSVITVNPYKEENFILIDWSNKFEYNFKNKIELINKVGELCSSTTEDMFGSVIVDKAFSGLAMYFFDEGSFEENGYDIVLDEIGGKIEENWDGFIPEEFVNSLFFISEILPGDSFNVENGDLIYKGKKFDAEDIFDDEPAVTYFTNDVMNF